MGEITFCCPHCDQRIAAPHEMLGSDVACPACGRDIRIPLDAEAHEAIARPETADPDRIACSGPATVPTRSRGSHKRLIAASATILVLFALLIFYVVWTRTPTYSLHRVAVALKTHDSALFQKHVDIPSVSARLIDDLVLSGLAESRPEDAAEALGTALGTGLIQLMKPRLVEEAKNQLARWVEQGNFGETNNSWGKLSSSGAVPDNFRGVDRVRKDGRVALVGLLFTNAIDESTFTVELRMRQLGSYWQVVEISNVRELMTGIQEREQAALARANAPIDVELSRRLQVLKVAKENRSDRYGIERKVVVYVTLRNSGDVDIQTYRAFLQIRTKEGTPIKTVPVRSDTKLRAGTTDDASWEFEVNQFLKNDVRVYESEIGDLQLEFQPRSVELTDGRKFSRYESTAEIGKNGTVVETQAYKIIK